MAVLYRVRQFLRAAGAWAHPQRLEELARCHLQGRSLELFQGMPRYDRQHALQVARTLESMGHSDPDLLVAALLHDAGKTGLADGRLRLWHRVTVVLVSAVSPALLEQIGLDRPGSWRRPFFVQRHHAAIGARLVAQAGCSPRVVELVLRHEDPRGAEGDPGLAALQAADSRN
jgi:putative nucleotidyltransferase with HDIG domain